MFLLAACGGGGGGGGAPAAPGAGVIPSPPENILAQATGSDSVQLEWTDVSDNESGFRVERASPNGEFREVGAADADSAIYQDSGLAASSVYRYRLIAFNESGDSAYSEEVSITTHSVVVDVQPKFAYVSTSQGVETFLIDEATGGLTLMPTEEAVLADLTSDATGRFLYGTRLQFTTASSIGVYAADERTGELRNRATATADWPRSMTVDPAGRFGFAQDHLLGGITRFVFDEAADALSLTSVTGAAHVQQIDAMTTDNEGEFLFVGHASGIPGNPPALETFRIDADTGDLTSVASVEVFVRHLRASPCGAFVYVADHASIRTYSVQPSGTLTLAGQVNITGALSAIAIDPACRFAYVAAHSELLSFVIDATNGTLTEVGTRQQGGQGSAAPRVDPTGRFVHWFRANYELATYVIDAETGALTDTGITTPLQGAFGESIAFTGFELSHPAPVN